MAPGDPTGLFFILLRHTHISLFFLTCVCVRYSWFLFFALLLIGLGKVDSQLCKKTAVGFKQRPKKFCRVVIISWGGGEGKEKKRALFKRRFSSSTSRFSFSHGGRINWWITLCNHYHRLDSSFPLDGNKATRLKMAEMKMRTFSQFDRRSLAEASLIFLKYLKL